MKLVLHFLTKSYMFGVGNTVSGTTGDGFVLIAGGIRPVAVNKPAISEYLFGDTCHY